MTNTTQPSARLRDAERDHTIETLREEMERRKRISLRGYPDYLLESVARNAEPQIAKAEESLWYWNLERNAALDELKRRQEARS